MRFFEWLFTSRTGHTLWIYWCIGVMIGCAWAGDWLWAIINGACAGCWITWRRRLDDATRPRQ